MLERSPSISRQLGLAKASGRHLIRLVEELTEVLVSHASFPSKNAGVIHITADATLVHQLKWLRQSLRHGFFHNAQA